MFATSLQELTLAGAHVRTIGEGVIDGRASSIVANTELIVVGTDSSTKQVLVFDATSGALKYSFGDQGTAEGQLFECVAVQFTPDGAHILVADYGSLESEIQHLSLFTLAGAFVRRIGTLKRPVDIDLSPSGDILVADRDNKRICLFTSDCTVCLRSIGSSSLFSKPRSLAMRGGQLYVLDQNTAHVQVLVPVSLRKCCALRYRLCFLTCCSPRWTGCERCGGIR